LKLESRPAAEDAFAGMATQKGGGSGLPVARGSPDRPARVAVFGGFDLQRPLLKMWFVILSKSAR